MALAPGCTLLVQLPLPQLRERVSAQVDRWVERLRERVPYTPGNRVELLPDGGRFFAAMEAAIAEAQHYVLVETYILRADKTGWRIARALAARANAGVEVALSYDGFGSLGLDHELLRFFAINGIRTLEFAPLSLSADALPWNRRNHRKTLVVDGAVALVGGLNIADDYAAVEDGGRGWRDTGCAVRGPAVAQLEGLFRETWARLGGATLRTEPRVLEPYADGHPARFVGNFARRGRADIRRAMLSAITRAQRSIRLTNAYFTPDGRFLRALVRAARRGVQVEIIVAGATDVKLVLLVSRGLYGYLMGHGVHIYEWHERILHAKTSVIDGEWVSIGSANLNQRSFALDLEANVTVVSPELGAQMDQMFEADRARSRAIDPAVWRQRPAWARLVEWFFGLFRRLM